MGNHWKKWSTFYSNIWSHCCHVGRQIVTNFQTHPKQLSVLYDNFFKDNFSSQLGEREDWKNVKNEFLCFNGFLFQHYRDLNAYHGTGYNRVNNWWPSNSFIATNPQKAAPFLLSKVLKNYSLNGRFGSCIILITVISLAYYD